MRGARKVWVSAKTGQGLDRLIHLVKSIVGASESYEGVFSARTRHLDALKRTQDHITAWVISNWNNTMRRRHWPKNSVWRRNRSGKLPGNTCRTTCWGLFSPASVSENNDDDQRADRINKESFEQ